MRAKFIQMGSDPLAEGAPDGTVEEVLGRIPRSRMGAFDAESSTIRPPERARILANFDNVEALCETTITVVAGRCVRTLHSTFASEAASRHAVASSRINIRGLCSSALAIANR